MNVNIPANHSVMVTDYDNHSLRLQAVVGAGTGPTAVTVDPTTNTVYVLDRIDGSVERIGTDPSLALRAVVPVGNYPSSRSPDPKLGRL